MNAFSFESFVLGFAAATLWSILIRVYWSPPRWYVRWKERRNEYRYWWYYLRPEERDWYRRHLPKEQVERYDSL